MRGSHDALETIEPLHHMDEAHEVALHLNGAVPGLEGEGGRPHRPEIRLEESLVEMVLDGARSEHGLGAQRDTDEAEAVPFGQPELRRVEFVAIPDEARMRIGFQRLIAGEDFLCDGSGAVESGNR